jgi:hypothetical protein
MTDKERQVQAAYNALSEPATPDRTTFTQTGATVPLHGWLRSETLSTDDYAEIARATIQAIMGCDSETSELVDDLIVACLYSADRSGLGSDEVWKIARKIKKMREAHE